MNPQIRFTLDCTQITRVLQMVAPFKQEANVRLRFAQDNIIFEVEEFGVNGIAVIGSQEVKPEWLDQNFFLQIGVLTKLAEVNPQQVEFLFLNDGEAWTALKLFIDGTELCIGLPIYDIELSPMSLYMPDTAKTERIDANKVAKAFQKSQVSDIKTSVSLGSIKLSRSFVFGTNASITIIEPFLESLSILSPVSFGGFISNLAKCSTELIFGLDEENNSLYLKSDNIAYKTFISPHEVQDLTALMAKDDALFVELPIQALRATLSRLSIPLLGKDSTLYLDFNNQGVTLKVLDIQNFESDARLQAKTYNGNDYKIKVSFNAFKTIIDGMESDLTIALKKSSSGGEQPVAILFKDNFQSTFLVAHN